MSKLLNEEKDEKSISSLKGNVLYKNLHPFYDVCHRVNSVEQKPLTLYKDRVVGNKHFIIDKSGEKGSGQIWGVRGIKFSNLPSNEVQIEVFVKEYHYKYDEKWGDHSYNEDKTVICKKCFDNDFSDWKEEKMLKIVHWLVLESESVIENIPGKEIGM